MSSSASRAKRLWIGGLAIAVLLVATAAPGFAAKEKTFGLAVTPSTLEASVSPVAATVFATLTNTTPGNSNPNSFTIHAPAGFIVTGARLSTSSNPNTSAVVTPAWGSGASADHVDVTGLDPLKNFLTTQQFVTIEIQVRLPALTNCGPDDGNLWYGTGYTGSNLTGDTFRRNSADADSTTTLNLTCALRFNPAPSDGVVGDDITTRVEAVAGSSSAPFSGTITLSLDASSAGALTGTGTETADATGGADFTLVGDTPGIYTVTATSSPSLGSPISASFQLYEGDLNCGDTVSDQGNDVYRGPNKLADDDCELVPYSATTTFTETEQSFEFLWDEGAEPNAQYKVVIAWPASPLDNPAYASDRPTYYNVTGDPADDKLLTFCDGMASSQDGGSVTFPVGSLTDAVSITETTLTVGPGRESPPSAPFDIFVDGEWMRVTAVVGTTWSVERGYGGTLATTHSAGSDNVLLALPIFPTDEQSCMSNTTTVGIFGTNQTQTTEEIWVKGDWRSFK